MDSIILTDIQQNKIFNDRMASYCMPEYGFEVLGAREWLLILFAHKGLIQDEDEQLTFVNDVDIITSLIAECDRHEGCDDCPLEEDCPWEDEE